MILGATRTSFLLLAGDLVAFAASLWLTLWLRYGALPSTQELAPFITPFAVLFVVWALVFYVSGLYSKRTTLFPSRLPDVLLRTQVVNIVVAAIFFFLIPVFGIAPKTTLAIYLAVSLALVYLWRLGLYPLLSVGRIRLPAALIAEGEEADELWKEVNGNARYPFVFVARDFSNPDTAILIVDATHESPAQFLNTSIHIHRFEDIYEEVFDRVPLSHLSHAWFISNVSLDTEALYTTFKRSVDIVGGLLMGLVTLVLLPFVYIAMRLEGSGAVFIAQERLGERGTMMRAYKFRSMEKNIASSGQWTTEGENRVTRVGAFLRKTSLDEFPQFINVLKGELSLIGPRNDIAGLGSRLAEALPYYNARYLVKPGITGWAQINQQYEQGHLSPQSVEETKVRLAYDFYYLKHRSIGLDMVIALKTIKRMFFRVSSW